MILRDPVHGLVAFEGIAERLIPALLAIWFAIGFTAGGPAAGA